MVTVGALYAHYKGGVYAVLAVAKEESTGKEVVVYQHATEKNVWVRPLDEFEQQVPGANTPRFLPLKGDKQEPILAKNIRGLGDPNVPLEIPFDLSDPSKLPDIPKEEIDKNLQGLIVASGKSLAAMMVIAKIPNYVWGSFKLDIGSRTEEFELTFRRKTGPMQTA